MAIATTPSPRLWSRWHKEYLHTLQQRQKWLKPTSSPILPGTLVLIKDDNTPPFKWQIGRIKSLHHGSDGIARVATVFTKQGSLKRPLKNM
ncbi:hypothetical protein NQ315_010997 [Exocentrus adspersus]|uniref:DUF5641 domain-containing protein n=1 Tax=Exocentrus adspersus TaxID=1586481 RepID=A0AAV8VJD9_9CUCU|nr:hypothetical protein NQ315_010997 [Exocentrus adspersus]